MLSWLLNGPLSLLFVLSGIVLNALCVLVFVRLRNAGSCSPPIIHYYLISLACWHSALLCNAFVLYCLPTLLWGSVISTGPYVHLYPPTYMLANATHTGTVWIVLALTLDRYLALCMPFKHRIFSKRSRVKRLVVGLSILAILFSLPRFFEVATAVECINTSKPQFPPTTTTKIPQLINNSSSSISFLILSSSSSSSSSPIIIECISYVQRTGLPQNQLYRSFYHILLGSTFVTILPGNF
uniref:G-protein coupled receptors family 1 profile domain-containing protein n=1 Tax=Meloidogyne incognita TaxID=6306 RepID=A0A914LMZ0_MELIC